MVYCRTSGIPWDEIYNWTVDEFADTYHALQRNEARRCLRDFATLGQAFGGDKKSVKAFIDQTSVWLPACERGGGVKGTDDFVALIKKGVNLKK